MAAAVDESDPCFGNTWELAGMPIKASYCNAWYTACFQDKFCGGADGNFFSCAELFSPSEQDDDDDNTLPSWAILLIVVLALLFLAGACLFGHTIRREIKGDPLFKPLTQQTNPMEASSERGGGL